MEEFFRLGCQIDEVKLIDLVMRRYHSLDALKVLDVGQTLKLLTMAVEEEAKEKYRQEWTALLPCMVFANHYMTFEQYYETVTGQNVDTRPAEEIMAEIDRKHAEAKAENEQSGFSNKRTT